MNKDWLGRVAPMDTKHIEKYPFGVRATFAANIEKVISRPRASQYNQKQTPRCVGYSTSKVMNWFNKMGYDADWLYKECKKIDGDPNGDGTNANAACQVLRNKGHWQTVAGIDVPTGPKLKHGIAAYHWATSVDQIRTVFSTALPQPVLLGINWYEAWFNPLQRNGEYWLQTIPNAGGIAGGHEIGIWACSDTRQAFGFSNTWGSGWPSLVWVPYFTVDKLLADGGDACIITDLASR